MGSGELKKRFGGSGGYYRNVIKPYFECVDETYKKGNGGYTKKWKLKSWLIDGIVKYLKDTTQIIISVVSDDEKGIVELNEYSENGVSSTHSNIFIPSTIDVNISLLDEYPIALKRSVAGNFRRRSIIAYIQS